MKTFTSLILLAALLPLLFLGCLGGNSEAPMSGEGATSAPPASAAVHSDAMQPLDLSDPVEGIGTPSPDIIPDDFEPIDQ